MTLEPSCSLEELQRMIDDSPFNGWLGVRVTTGDADSETLEMVMPFRPELERSPGTGQIHGGPIASFIDVAGDFVLIWALGYGVPTINFRTDYLRPGTGTELRARATIRRAGRTVGVVDIDVLDSEDRLVAVGRGCYGTWSG
ncbi:MAG: PaaI family thioesterase [Acidobacteriota bacterium]